ncbi:hypothetical protein D043_4064B, partial [Vibrio parahaemolyticus EKP-021]
LGETPETASTS